MNRKENIIKVLNGENTGCIPVTPHWWGLYKFEHYGFVQDYSRESEAWGLAGRELATIDSYFFESFQPDMFHLSTGSSRLEKTKAEQEENKRLMEAVRKLDSYPVIDEYVAATYPSKSDVLKSGVFDHIQILSDQYGEDNLLMLNEGNPICWVLDPNGLLGFENGLISIIEKPDKVEYLLHKCHEALIPRMEALKEMGGDGYIGSETYCSADIMSPKYYHSIVFEAQKNFYTALNDMGLIPVTYFLGDINPLLDDIKQLGVKGLMVEESKKTFTLDIGTIYERLEGEICLFGNLDSIYTLQMGSRDDVKKETERQMEACNKGAFIMANGCPISFTTPPKNIHEMIQTVRNISCANL